MKVYALVGPSGTGKSYKALEVAYEHDIKYIIDDGLLIYKNKIIAGISAKQANTVMEAVKRAIFNDENHRCSVRKKIQEEQVDKILVLGTSNKMVHKIVHKLDMEEIHKLINIKDISTEKEIFIAKESRKQGNHIIPVPTVEMKPIASGLSINSLKRFFIRKNNTYKEIEKTIIRPTFSYAGKFFINTNVIEQIINYEVNKFKKVDKINKMEVNNINSNINIILKISINDITQIRESYKIQKVIKENIEKITSINVEKVDIHINKLKSDTTLRK
ncbi:MAG: ATP-binding protein [Romboutsia sp.]|uniref:ATP-binding protein n=1 Tax=Romboutsia sp. TaxID=1965302 RepID=UPI003F3C66F2